MNKVVSKRFRPNHSRKNAKTTLCELRFLFQNFDVFVNFLNKKLTIAEKARTHGAHEKIGTLYGFDLMVKSETTAKDGFDVIQNRFFIKGEGEEK